MVAFDPLSVLAGAGPLAAALAWTLSETRDMRKSLEGLTASCAKANADLAIAMNARADTDRALRYSIDRLRDAFAYGKITHGDPAQVADQVSQALGGRE